MSPFRISLRAILGTVFFLTCLNAAEATPIMNAKIYPPFYAVMCGCSTAIRCRFPCLPHTSSGVATAKVAPQFLREAWMEPATEGRANFFGWLNFWISRNIAINCILYTQIPLVNALYFISFFHWPIFKHLRTSANKLLLGSRSFTPPSSVKMPMWVSLQNMDLCPSWWYMPKA